MRLSCSFLLLLFACSCRAGPLVALVVVATEAVAGAAAAASVASSAIAAAFGVTASAIWFGEFVVVNGVLFYGSAVAGAGALAGGVAGGVEGSVNHGAEVTDKGVESSVLSAWSSAHSASMTLQPMGKKSTEYNSANDPFTFTSPSTGAKKSSSADAPTTTAPAPDAEPAKASLDSKNHRLEIPPGVPEYNFRMCQNEIIAMGKKNQALTFDQPLNQSILVGNVPPTCMVLATVIAGDPLLGPHPVPMGASSLQWNNVNTKAIDLIRQGFGQKPMFRKQKQQ